MENFDVYDKDRRTLGYTYPRGTKLKNDEYRTVVHICVFNKNGEMLIQQRASCKKLWANKWDITAGGNVMAGESSSEGASRELYEELGINVDFSNIRPHFTINFENGFDDYYFLNLELNLNDLTLQEDEVQSVKWASKAEVEKMFDDGLFLPYIKSFALSLFDLKNQYGVIID